jgi:hypothetical protein
MLNDFSLLIRKAKICEQRVNVSQNQYAFAPGPLSERQLGGEAQAEIGRCISL